MSPWGVAVLLSWLSGCGSAVWRYACNSPEYMIFSTRSTIKLEYEGTSFSEWSVPETCSVQDKRSPKTVLRCSLPGVQIIKPIVTGPDEEERYLSVDESHICFLWYHTIKSDYKNFTETIMVWVYDPENADPDELQHSAKIPSLNSIVLTKQLATLGQKPLLYTVLRRRIFEPDEIMTNGTWIFKIPMTYDDMLKRIQGNQVPFQDCFISDLTFLLTFSFLTLPEVAGFLPITLPAGSPAMAVWSTCNPSIAVLLSDMETFVTTSSFHTWTRVRVPPNILSDAERRTVARVTILRAGLLFLINGSLYYKTSQAFTRLNSSHGLPDEELLGISSSRWCWVKYLFKTSRQKSMVATWTKNEFYLGYPSLKFAKTTTTTELKNLMHLSPTDTLAIENIEYTGHPLEIAVFLSHHTAGTGTKQIYIMTYNEDSALWIYQDFALEIPTNSFLVARFLFSALPTLIMWDKHRVYYCYYNFTVTGVLRTSTGEEDLSLASEGSLIHDVFVDYHGSIIIKMENNMMFFSKIYIGDAVKLHLWASKTTKVLLFFSTSSEVYLVYVFDNSTVQPGEYPLNLEVQSATFKSKDKCPYIAFHNNVFSIAYFLDKGENLTLWSQLVYSENYGLYITLEYNGPKILEWEKAILYENALGYCTKTMTMTFFQSIDYEGIDDYFGVQEKNTGLMLFNIRPSEYSKICPMAQRVFQVVVGCDSHKYIAVKGFNKTGCQHHEFTYVIDKSFLRHRPPKNLKIRYDWVKYGCPMKVDFRDKFHPVLQLFDENGYVEDVPVNFILWEIHGREDYSYSNTMEESGCLNEAQTWKTMIDLNQNLSIEHVWGPENYQPCFSYAIGKPGDLTQPYEIINISNNNHLFWPMELSGIYVFRVKILDPNYSFCNLTTTFTIETFGVIPRPSLYMVTAFLFVLTVLFLSLLVLSYFHYTNIYRQHIYEPLHKPPRKQKKN